MFYVQNIFRVFSYNHNFLKHITYGEVYNVFAEEQKIDYKIICLFVTERIAKITIFLKST